MLGTPQNMNTEGRLLTDERFLRKIASLYYEEGYTQEEIALQECCSRQTIGKALQKAKERGIVRISVIPDERTGYLRNLAREVRLRLGLDDIVLVPGLNVNDRYYRMIDDHIVSDIAATAADYLDQMIMGNDIVAVSGGKRVMRQIVCYLKPSKVLPSLQVVPTIGFVQSHTSFGDSNLIAYDIATAYGAKPIWLPIPAIVESEEQCRQARSLPIVRDVLKIMEKATIILLSVWLPHENEELVEKGILSRQQLDRFLELQPVTDVNHWFFDKEGRCLNEDPQLSPPPFYLTGLEIPTLRDRLKSGNVHVILIAGGSIQFVPAIQAVLRAGIVNILVTDHITASRLVEG
uniref:DNA-binding transcriptional regulator n=1 Tax=Thermosporothrix sp. COM3 TaxID=2490863 RepID=A0A455SEY4_9CHLR|nr:DNA-binding transcriptional regulator [Thermosporothrix sp. COM3]